MFENTALYLDQAMLLGSSSAATLGYAFCKIVASTFAYPDQADQAYY